MREWAEITQQQARELFATGRGYKVYAKSNRVYYSITEGELLTKSPLFVCNPAGSTIEFTKEEAETILGWWEVADFEGVYCDTPKERLVYDKLVALAGPPDCPLDTSRACATPLNN